MNPKFNLKETMTFKFTISMVFLFISSMSLAQERTCGTDEFMREKLLNPVYKENYKSRQESFQSIYKTIKSNLREQNQETTIIPVAVHFPTADESIRPCLVDLVKDQIRILNEDFSGTNSDISNWEGVSNHFPEISTGNINVKFVLATKNHPENTDEDLLEGEPAVTIGWAFDESDSDMRWVGYQNIVVKELPGGILGYSPKGGAPNFGDTLVISNSVFGSGSGCDGFRPSEPFNLGRTLTHELGHFYNLDHTWGGDGGCGLDDGIEDTPTISGPTYGCVTPGSVTMCNNIALTTNYMDYVNDACMFMFTEGQAMIMNAYLTSIRRDWKTNVTQESTESEEPPILVEGSFNIFPNPVDKELTVSLPNEAEGIATFTLHDLSGKLIFTRTLNLENEFLQIKVNTSEMANGLYFFDFNSSAFSRTMKIVVNH